MSRFALVAAAGLVASASAQVVDGGGFDSEYGSALYVQSNGTQFGNNTDADILGSNGSELNAVYGQVVGSTLFLAFAGNVESNFNNFELFIDSTAGGQNTLLDNNANIGFDNSLNRNAGLTFDSGFAADYYIQIEVGNGEVFVNTANLLDMGGGMGGFAGSSGMGNNVANVVGTNGNGISVGVNNSNVLGVNSLGNAFDSDPATVFTGIEVAIDLAELGLAGAVAGEILIAGGINGGSSDFLSNQIIGLGGNNDQGNLGDPAFVDYNQFAGEQFVRVAIPAPGVAAVMGLGGLAAVRRRR